MPFLAPLALLGLAFLPLIVVFYLLKLRRDERRVSSTFLWRQLVQDVEANAPWQRLRRSLLFFLQLLLVVALALLAARPYLEHPAGLARDLVLVIDASASMSATDELPSRLAAAKSAALHALDGLPSDGRVSLVVAAGSARVLANESTDRGRLARAIGEIEPTAYSGGLGDALKLASKLADRHAGTEVLLVTDAAVPSAPDVKVNAPLRVITVGRDRANQAVVALAVRSDPSAITRSLFVSVANYDTKTADRQLEVRADGALVDTRGLYIDPLSRADVVIDDLPPAARIVEARLAASADEPKQGGEGGSGGGASQPDQLALDDTAWTIVPQTRLRTILLVGEGNAYLQSALSLLPNVELYGATPQDYAKTTGKELFDLIIFDGFLPPELPDKPILAIAPPRTSDLGTVSGTLTAPAIGQLDPSEPLLRYVDLSTTHVAKAQKLALPSWARTVIPGPGDAPLLYSGSRDGLATAVIAFDLHQSDLPLQVAFPVLVANLAGELFGQTTGPIGAQAPGAPVELPLPADATGLLVTRPDGTTVEVPVSVSGAGSVTFAQTGQLGVYRVETKASGVSSSTSPGASPSTSAAASPSPGLSPPSPPATPEAERFFAVDLFDEGESNITPGNGSALEALGTPAVAGPPTTAVTRDELWFPLALLALVVLLAEWAIYERDGFVRLRRALAGGPAALRSAVLAAVGRGGNGTPGGGRG